MAGWGAAQKKSHEYVATKQSSDREAQTSALGFWGHCGGNQGALPEIPGAALQPVSPGRDEYPLEN